MNKDFLLFNRRQFIKGIAGTGLLSLAPVIDVSRLTDSNTDLLERFIKVLAVQASYHNDKLEQENIANLTYAYNAIKPSNHIEMAMVVACGKHYQPFNHIVDEYVRRKNGKQPTLPDHPILALETWGVPYTHRVLIFREQMDALLKEFQVHSPTKRQQLLYRLFDRRTRHQKIKELINKDRCKLNSDEINTLIEAVSCYLETGWHLYTYCSTMVNRAEALANSHATTT